MLAGLPTAEIRRIAANSRARRQATSRVMMILCGVALALAAVPLLLLVYQLLERGLPVLNATFFTKEPQSPTLVAPNATGGVSNAIIGSIALAVYAGAVRQGGRAHRE